MSSTRAFSERAQYHPCGGVPGSRGGVMPALTGDDAPRGHRRRRSAQDAAPGPPRTPGRAAPPGARGSADRRRRRARQRRRRRSRRAHPARPGPGRVGCRGGGTGDPATDAAAGVVGGGRPPRAPLRGRVARARGPPARGVAAARGRRFHRPGERRARRRRPRSACGGRSGRRVRLRRRARDRTAGPRPDRVTVGPRRDGGRLGARRASTRPARRSRCWSSTWTG